MIEVFVHSVSAYVDVERYREMSQHTYCAQGFFEALITDFASKFKGRILRQEDYTILERVSEIAEETKEKVMIYDVARVADRLRAAKSGVRKTPTVIINGEKYEGVEEILQGISSKV